MSVNVLIVDDSPFMRNILKNIIIKDDFVLAGEAGNGLEAVELYQRLKPDLVTMDIIMPEMNGIDAVKQIQAINPQSKVVMVSAMGQQAMVIDAIQAGARDFIIKPFQAPRVHDALKRVLS